MKARIAALILTLVLLTVFATAFAIINYTNTVKVWPLMSFEPLTLVIGVSFVLGAAMSGLLVSLLTHKRTKNVASPALDGLPTNSVDASKRAVRL